MLASVSHRKGKCSVKVLPFAREILDAGQRAAIGARMAARRNPK